MNLNPDLLRLLPDAASRIDDLLTRSGIDIAMASVALVQLPSTVVGNRYRLGIVAGADYAFEGGPTRFGMMGVTYKRRLWTQQGIDALKQLIECNMGGAIVPVAQYSAHADMMEAIQ